MGLYEQHAARDPGSLRGFPVGKPVEESAEVRVFPAFRGRRADPGGQGGGDRLKVKRPLVRRHLQRG